MNVIDLFCGCGGFSKGFEKAGFEIKLGIDIWQDAINTYQYNFPHALSLVSDLSNLQKHNPIKTCFFKEDEIDVIIGGPPCQGFSLSGKRDEADPRNNLYKSFLQIVAEIKPKAFVLENVPGLIRLFKGQVKDNIIKDFNLLNYNVFVQELNSCHYGVPQARHRVFFVGLNRSKLSSNKYHFTFPSPTHGEKLLPLVSSEEALSDLDFIGDDRCLLSQARYELPARSLYQQMMREDTGEHELWNHVVTKHTEQTKNIIAQVPDGGNYKNLPLALQNTRNVHIAWTRMHSQKPCFTIDTGHNHHFHYRANRVPTVRESARIQSFPDSFKFLGSKTSQLRQVGNAVPPLLAEALAKSLLDFIK